MTLRSRFSELSRRSSTRPSAVRKMHLGVEVLEARTLLSGNPSLTVVLAPHTIAENAGAGAATGTVIRNNMDNSQALTVNLTSSDTTQATVPATVTIPAGSASAAFSVNAVDNGIVDPMHTVTITATAGNSAPPGLDPTFGSGGYTSVPLTVSSSANLPEVKMQPDGKILAVAAPPGNTATWAITRTLPNGSPDTSFGNNGTVLTTFAKTNSGDSRNCGNGIALQPDGKIIVVGNIYPTTSTYGGWGIARYNADGSPDTSFGTNGQTTFLPTGEGGWLYDVTVLSNGKILVGGNLQDPKGFAVARFTSSGQLDTSFGTNGVASLNPDPTHSWYNTGGQAMLVQPDGKILMTGMANYTGLPVARFNADGTPDTTFNGNGVEVIPLATFGNYASIEGTGLAVQGDGKVVVVGFAYTPGYSASNWTVARVNTNGGLDMSFHGTGVDVVGAADFFPGGPTGGTDNAYDVLIQPDGRIVVGGDAVKVGTGYYMALVRYNTDGSRDTSLGTNGTLTTQLPGPFSTIWSIAEQADGKVTALATAYTSTYIARFNMGPLSASDTLTVFDSDGLPVPDTGGPYTVAEGDTVQLDASATTDPTQDPSTLTYTWDLNGNGIFGETGPPATRGDEVGLNPTFSAVGLTGPSSVVVYLKVTDDAGSTSYAQTVINIINVPPTADFSNNGPVNEGSPVTVTFSNAYDPSPIDTYVGFHYSFATDPSALATTYASAGTASSAAFTFNTDGSYTIYGRIFDKEDGYTDYQTTVTVNGLPPTANVSGPTDTLVGQTQTYTFTAVAGAPDDGPAGFTYAIDWGDGSTDSISGPGSIQVDHTYTDVGTYTVQVLATDEDGVQSVQPGTLSVNVTAGAIKNGGDLVISGTPGNDRIIIKPVDASGDLGVTINGKTLPTTYHPTGRILVYATAGNDSIQLQSLKVHGRVIPVNVSAFIFGGAGNDTIDVSGSSANNVLIGGSGNNYLQGGSGRDILIAGRGGSVLRGGRGDDILIGGTTAYDNNLAALTALLAEWGRTDLDYQARINLMSSGTYPLTAKTVHANGAVNPMFGRGEQDWFFASTSDPIQAYLRDRRNGDVVTLIS